MEANSGVPMEIYIAIIIMLGILFMFAVGSLISSRRKNSKLEIENSQLKKSLADALKKQTENAPLDSLTGLLEREHFLKSARHELEHSYRYHEKMTLVRLDLDALCRVNEVYGEAKGDELLRVFAAMLKNSWRADDIVGRWGEDEFILLLTNTPLASCMSVLEQIRQYVEQIPFIGKGKRIHLTISIGAVEIHESDKDLDAILQRGADALQRAKTEGGNRIITG